MPSTQATPCVGRQPEFAALLQILHAAHQGAGGLVLVTGEPGIGKTRLLTELAARARTDGWIVLTGRAYQAAGMPPYLPFADALREYVRTTPLGQLRTQLRDGAADIALIVRELQQRLPGSLELPLRSPDLERHRLFESVAGFLLAVARGVGREQESEPPLAVAVAPPGLLLILDDLHWADAPSLLLLVYLARRFSDAPTLIAGTYRGTEVDPDSHLHDLLAALTREQPGERIMLSGLGVTDIANFSELAVGVRPAASVLEAIAHETDGNPLFVTELVHLLAQEGLLAHTEREPAWRHIVPQSLHQLIGQRLDRLSATCLGTLAIAAVIGREFDVPVLERAGDLIGDGLMAALEEAKAEAEAARVVVAVPGAPGRFGFAHPLMRETLYTQLLTIRRVRLHRPRRRSAGGLPGQRRRALV